jgi:uncharacterized damage-inducible protein DinB
MNKMLLTFVLLVASLSAAANATPAQTPDAASTDHTAPSYDMKGQALVDLDTVQKKFAGLANAIPADKMTWRPSPDSRSFAEVFLHVAGGRYQILGLMGTAAPEGFDPKTFEKSTTDQAKIVAELNKSWEFAQKAIKGMTNADFAKLLPKLGPQANAGDVVYILVADAHEHLGQVVAYARVNGIVPPWTAAAQKKDAAKKSEQK